MSYCLHNSLFSLHILLLRDHTPTLVPVTGQYNKELSSVCVQHNFLKLKCDNNQKMSIRPFRELRSNLMHEKYVRFDQKKKENKEMFNAFCLVGENM